ncbi:DUF397 domain-containing protein [Actinomadura harenae]|uniref:DUF397 domain-containing protein n=1 Tax=Actinomadura harenae TaxID=2483351 RepID=UPI00361EC918
MTTIWRKSSHSDAHGQCVELADLGRSVGIRDSKKPDAGHFQMSARALAFLLATIKADD